MVFGVRKNVLLVCLLLLVTIATSGRLVTAYAADAQTDILQAADKEKSGEYVRQHFFKQLEKPFNPGDQRKKMLVIGDSHAQDFYNALLENKLDQRYQPNDETVIASRGICQYSGFGLPD